MCSLGKLCRELCRKLCRFAIIVLIKILILRNPQDYGNGGETAATPSAKARVEPRPPMWHLRLSKHPRHNLEENARLQSTLIRSQLMGLESAVVWDAGKGVEWPCLTDVPGRGKTP